MHPIRLFSLLMFGVLSLHPLSSVYAAATAQVVVAPSGQANVTLSYTYSDFDVEYAAYTSGGEVVFKSAIVVAVAVLGWVVDANMIGINADPASKTMAITFTINSFVKVSDGTRQILLGPAKSVYTNWTRTGGTFTFTSASKPGLPLPEGISLQLPANAVDIQFDSINYVITYKYSGCLIVTALYGSPLQPEVQFLRHFRDDTLVKAAGGSFVNNLNAWYYSFSPEVSEYIMQNEWTRPPLILLISPVISFLHLVDAIIQMATH